MNHLYCKNLTYKSSILERLNIKSLFFGKTMQRILQEKDRIRLKGKRVNIKQASKRFCYTHQKVNMK